MGMIPLMSAREAELFRTAIRMAKDERPQDTYMKIALEIARSLSFKVDVDDIATAVEHLLAEGEHA